MKIKEIFREKLFLLKLNANKNINKKLSTTLCNTNGQHQFVDEATPDEHKEIMEDAQKIQEQQKP